MTKWYGDVPAPTDKDGRVVPLDTKELVCRGKTREVYCFVYNIRFKDWFVDFCGCDYIRLGDCTLPDSWEKLDEDARKTPREYIEGRGITDELGGRVATMTSDILRRAKALAGVTEND